MCWKTKITNQVNQASKRNSINKELKKLAKTCLMGDTEFFLVYSNGRGQYVNIIFKEQLTTKTARLLLLNGFKNFYLNNK